MTYDADVELRKWISQKNGVVRDWGEKSGQLLSAFAGRGFSKPPGESQALLSELGQDFKNKLNELSVKIMAESMGVGVEDTAHDNSITIGNYQLTIDAQIDALLQAFEVEKENLNTFYAIKIEDWARIQKELDAREVILIEGRQAITDGLADLELDLIEARRIPFGKQVLLLEEKVVTANAKLAIIPHLQNILIEETALIASKIITMNKRETLFPPQEELVDALLAKADANLNTITDLRNFVTQKYELLSERESLITAKEFTLGVRDMILTQETLIQTDRRQLQTDRRQVEEKRKIILTDQKNAVEAEEDVFKEEIVNKGKEESRIEEEDTVVTARENVADEVETLAGERADFVETSVESIGVQYDFLVDANDFRFDLLEDRVTSEEDMAVEEIDDVFDKRLDLIKKSEEFDLGRHDDALELIGKEDEISESVINIGLDARDDVLEIEEDIATAIRELKVDIQDAEVASHSSVVVTEVDSDKDTLDRVGFYQRATTTIEAQLRSAADVTATVAHTIAG